MYNKSTCHDAPCDQSVAERPRYYARQLITADDLTLEQDYFRSKLRLHNRLLHGWGVVCGAEVSSVPKVNSMEKEPWLVLVKPGYILGPYGDEIYIDCEHTVDLRRGSLVGVTGEPCGEVVDPWCNEIYEPRDNGKLYVAVKYKQVATRPVRVQPIGCGCDDTSCENSRWRDGYEIRILNAWPDCGATPPNLDNLFKGPIPQCAPCPDEPWVVLAEVTVETDGKITKIDTCACRRLAASFMNVWWACTEGTATPGCTKVDDYKGNLQFVPDETARLDAFARRLKNEPGMIGYIMFYGPNQADMTKRTKNALEYLVGKVGIDARRISTRHGELPEPRAQLYICDPDALPPPIVTTAAASSGIPAGSEADTGEIINGSATSPPASAATSMSASSSGKRTPRKRGATEP